MMTRSLHKMNFRENNGLNVVLLSVFSKRIDLPLDVWKELIWFIKNTNMKKDFSLTMLMDLSDMLGIQFMLLNNEIFHVVGSSNIKVYLNVKTIKQEHNRFKSRFELSIMNNLDQTQMKSICLDYMRVLEQNPSSIYYVPYIPNIQTNLNIENLTITERRKRRRVI
jgi:hypothetical protein